MYKKFGKRLLDILLSGIALVILSPLLLLLTILVKIKFGSPVLFNQERPGLIDSKTGRERIFKIHKFRTMTDKRDEKGELLPDTQRLTSFGRLLRSTSLDELPELLNIFKGDMSLVGPRPLAMIYLKYYTKLEHHRHDVRPGLTGLAQVSGRNSISWEDKFKYDLEYIKDMSLVNDMKIVLLTVKKVISRSDIGQAELAPESLHIIRKDWLDDKGDIKREYQQE